MRQVGTLTELNILTNQRKSWGHLTNQITQLEPTLGFLARNPSLVHLQVRYYPDRCTTEQGQSLEIIAVFSSVKDKVGNPIDILFCMISNFVNLSYFTPLLPEFSVKLRNFLELSTATSKA